jgi:hypothetical protein
VKHSPSSVIPKRSPFQEIGNITLPRQRWGPRRMGGLVSAETWVGDGLLQWSREGFGRERKRKLFQFGLPSSIDQHLINNNSWPTDE